MRDLTRPVTPRWGVRSERHNPRRRRRLLCDAMIIVTMTSMHSVKT